MGRKSGQGLKLRFGDDLFGQQFDVGRWSGGESVYVNNTQRSVGVGQHFVAGRFVAYLDGGSDDGRDCLPLSPRGDPAQTQARALRSPPELTPKPPIKTHHARHFGPPQRRAKFFSRFLLYIQDSARGLPFARSAKRGPHAPREHATFHARLRLLAAAATGPRESQL